MQQFKNEKKIKKQLYLLITSSELKSLLHH